jgi:hypothetical protein
MNIKFLCSLLISRTNIVSLSQVPKLFFFKYYFLDNGYIMATSTSVQQTSRQTKKDQCSVYVNCEVVFCSQTSLSICTT